ncbi:MAG: hypothetical protein ACKOXQ_03175 [Hydrogenophaga sp.]
MAIPWLTALRVIPWGDVIEHAPKVLHAARDLVERQRRRDTETPAPTPAAVDTAQAPWPALLDVQHRLASTHDDLVRLQHTQDQITQTLAELAEQNSRLVATVELLRKRTRLLMLAVVLLGVAGGWALLA